jgi:hypothetical protein
VHDSLSLPMSFVLPPSPLPPPLPLPSLSLSLSRTHSLSVCLRIHMCVRVVYDRCLELMLHFVFTFRWSKLMLYLV